MDLTAFVRLPVNTNFKERFIYHTMFYISLHCCQTFNLLPFQARRGVIAKPMNRGILKAFWTDAKEVETIKSGRPTPSRGPIDQCEVIKPPLNYFQLSFLSSPNNGVWWQQSRHPIFFSCRTSLSPSFIRGARYAKWHHHISANLHAPKRKPYSHVFSITPSPHYSCMQDFLLGPRAKQ